MPHVTLTKTGTTVKFTPHEVDLLRRICGLSLPVMVDKSGPEAVIRTRSHNIDRHFVKELIALQTKLREGQAAKARLARRDLAEQFRNKP